MRKTAALLSAGALLLAPLAGLAPAPLAGFVTPAYADTKPAPVKAAGVGADAIAGQYTVVLDDGTNVDRAIAALPKGAHVKRIYRSALRGFTVTADAATANQIAAQAHVQVIQQDARVHVSDVSATATEPVPAPPSTYWGLNRIDQRTLPANAAGSYNYYWTGSGVTAYVIDTGINYTHTQFGGRASLGIDLVGDGFNPPGGDCYGHGTHVAGTIGGSTYGVAKSVSIKSVRVLDCGGSASFSTVIAGIDWVTAHAAHPAVVNMSLGGGADIATNIALNNMVESGVTAVVAAGNSADDACNYTPASTLSAITVGATGVFEDPNAPISDARSSFSNYGSCVDIFAPGSNILSSYIGSNTATAVFSGTSMATPHVAGVAALYLSAIPTALPVTVRNYLVGIATNGAVSDPGTGSPNKLLYSGGKASLTADAAPEPVLKASKLTVTGKLSLGGFALIGRTVQVWFDKSGSTPPVLVGTAVTSRAGTYTRTQAATADGNWYARYLSQPLIAGTTSAPDFVDCSNC